MLCFHVERFCLSCHGDALLADTSGGWALLTGFTSPCMHVPMYSLHKHTDQCTVRCLWRMVVAYWTSTSASTNTAIPTETVRPRPEDFAEGAEALMLNSGDGSPSEPWTTTWWSIKRIRTHRDSRRVLIANNIHIHCSHRRHNSMSADCTNQLDAKGKHQDIPLDNHVIWLYGFLFCFYHRIKIIF